MMVHRRTTYVLEKMMRFYFLKDETPILPINNNHFCRYGWDYYLYQTYKYDLDKFKNFEMKENAMDLFYQKGGRFYKYELENIKFQRLKNNDFVLNKELDKNEVQELFKNIRQPLPGYLALKKEKIKNEQ